MTSKASATPMRKVPLFTTYVVVWSMFGVMALGLLAVLGFAPEWLDDLRPGARFIDPQTNQGARAAARLAADVDDLKSSINQMHLDLSKIRTDLAAQNEQQKAVSSQVADLEERFSSGTVTAATTDRNGADPSPNSKTSAAQAKKQKGKAPVAADDRVAETATTTPVAAEQKPSKNSTVTPRVINADAAAAPSRLETSSVTKIEPAEEITFGPAVVKPEPQKFGVKLSSGASVESLRLSWGLLSEIHGDKLGQLQPRYTTRGNTTFPEYDLIAGPVNSQTDAVKLCKELAAQGVTCSIGTFAGNAL